MIVEANKPISTSNTTALLQVGLVLWLLLVSPATGFAQKPKPINHHFKHHQSFIRHKTEVDRLIQGYDYKNTNYEIAFSLFLIGDSGEPDWAPEVIEGISSGAKSVSQKSAMIFLGDNVYPNGLPRDNRKDYDKAAEKLWWQMNALAGYKGRVYFVPGNHDYHKINKFIGRKRVKNQARFIDEKGGENFHFTPAIHSRKAVELVELDFGEKKIGMVVMDIEWFLYHGYWGHWGWRIKQKRFWQPLNEILSKDFDHWLIATHHPMYSVSIHGVEKGWYSKVDLQKAKYSKLISKLRVIFDNNKFKNVIYAAGHDHTLQFFTDHEIDDDRHFGHHIVSGAGSKKSYILESEIDDQSELSAKLNDETYLQRRGIKYADEYAKNLMFAENSTGWARLDFHVDGSVWLVFIGYPKVKEQKLYLRRLY